MSVNIVKVQLRRGTAATWASVNPILAQGEPSLETDTGVRKLGDGVTHYNTLPADLTNVGVLTPYTSPRPASGTPIWTGGTSATPPAAAVTNDFWIHP